VARSRAEGYALLRRGLARARAVGQTGTVLYNSLLFVHVLAAAVWLGGGVMLLYLVRRAAAAGLPAVAGVAGAAATTGSILGAAGGVTFLAGIGLVLAGPWEFEQAFVTIGVLVFVVVSVVGARLVGPACESLSEAAIAGDRAAVAAPLAKVTRFSLVNVGLLTLAVASMSWKWGA
jgi:uncharacterized membrane protein